MNEIRPKLAAINEINQKTINVGVKDLPSCGAHMSQKIHTHQLSFSDFLQIFVQFSSRTSRTVGEVNLFKKTFHDINAQQFFPMGKI